MRLSVSTKIFFAFVAVIIAFGLSSFYSFLRTAELRKNVVFLRQGAFPIRDGYLRLEEKLRSYYADVLEPSRRSSELEKQRDRLPALQPFRDIDVLADRMRQSVEQAGLEEEDRERFALLIGGLMTLTTSTALYEGLYGDPITPVPAELGSMTEPLPNGELLDRLSRAFVQAVDEGRTADAARLAQDLRRSVQELWRSIKSQRRELDRIVAAVNNKAEDGEARAMLTAAGSTATALFVSLVVLVLTQLATSRVRDLIEGVRRISRGDYQERVHVRGRDEFAQLAQEFNAMAESLAERDRMLAAQREELLRADRLATIGKMSAQITHEIRNPLSSMGLNAELLDEELDGAGLTNDAEARALLRAITGEIDRLTQVTDQYLRYARLPRPQVEPVDLATLTENLLAFVAEEAHHRGVEIALRVSERPKVMADEGQVWQALLNIVRNGFEALEGGGLLQVDVNRRDTMGEVSVADSGPGVPPELRERIFDPFFSTKEHGTGLGLPLVREIASEHGGTLHCEQSPGGGALFVFRLPIA